MVSYLVLDTETGGTDPLSDSILSLAGYKWIPGGEPELVFDISVKERPLCVDASALNVNKIDLNEIVLRGSTPADASSFIKQRMRDSFGENEQGEPQKATLVGHNIAFDVNFLKRLFRLGGKPDLYDELFVHRTVDTSSCMALLMMLGMMPQGKSSSDRLFELTGVEVSEKDRHTARGDAYATCIAMNRLIERYRKD